MSALQVYDATNGAGLGVTPPSPTDTAVLPDTGPLITGQSTWGAYVNGDTIALRANTMGVDRMPPLAAGSADEPYRVPSHVMRIFVQAWEDEQGDLHMPGYLYSEIEPRRWSVGQPALDTSGTFRLLDGSGSPAAHDAQAPAAATAGARHPNRVGASTQSSLKGITQ
jgi:hypothetical protein